jgi:NADH:ubiquinone oxidoreductase subunit D
MNMPFTDRLDYLSSMSNNFGYALAVEKLMGIKPPERAEYIRVIMAELTRISNHVWAIGFLLNDLGAFFTPALYAIEERELILDIFEAVAGSRMMCNYFRFGGVARDLPDGVLEKIRELVFDRLPRNFDVAVRYHGDVYDRYLIRMDEVRQSIRILQQAVRDIPEGSIQEGKPQYQVRVPAGESYGRVEGPKGELGYYVVSTGKPNPWRYHVRAPSFINLTALNAMCQGNKIADAVAILGSIDIVLGETDR